VYGVFYQERQVLDRPVRFHSIQKLVEIGTCCAILHNMIVTHRPKEAHAPEPGTYQLILAASCSFFYV